jgi:hypothetical protein
MCEMMFYFFAIIFIAVTAIAFFDGVELPNLLPIDTGDAKGVLQGTMYMFLPFSVVVYMMFFADRVNFDDSKFMKQSFKSTGLVTVLTCAVLVLTIGQLGVFGVQYLQLPYFSITRQISILGPLKNIGSIVFSLWILADFALVATLAYTSASIGQRMLKHKHRNVHVIIVAIAVAIIAIFAWRDMVALDWFLSTLIMPISVATSIGIPVVLFAVGTARGKIKFGKNTPNATPNAEALEKSTQPLDQVANGAEPEPQKS